MRDGLATVETQERPASGACRLPPPPHAHPSWRGTDHRLACRGSCPVGHRPPGRAGRDAHRCRRPSGRRLGRGTDVAIHRVRFALALGEGHHVIGFAERFDHLDQSGRRLDAVLTEGAAETLRTDSPLMCALFLDPRGCPGVAAPAPVDARHRPLGQPRHTRRSEHLVDYLPAGARVDVWSETRPSTRFLSIALLEDRPGEPRSSNADPSRNAAVRRRRCQRSGCGTVVSRRLILD